jgi:hypothetical protein
MCSAVEIVMLPKYAVAILCVVILATNTFSTAAKCDALSFHRNYNSTVPCHIIVEAILVVR